MTNSRGRRPIRVATVSHRPSSGTDSAEGLDRLMTSAEVQIERAARMGADLVAFPECYPQLAVPDLFHHPEPTESGTIVRASEAARKHRVYLVWPRLEYDADRGVRNTAVLIDRSGEIVGRYDKMFPTIGEIEKGVTPGVEAPCFETDFGRLGMLICFDLNFAEVREKLARGRPDVVVFPSMYRGGLQVQALAFELGAFVVSAISSELGVVCDRCGRVLKETTYEALGVAPINTNSVALHMNENMDRVDAMLRRYGPDLTVDYHTREAYMVYEYRGSRDIQDLIAEFCLERADSYFDRARGVRNAAVERFQAKKTVGS